MGAFTFRLTRLTTLYPSWLWLTRVSWITAKLDFYLSGFFGTQKTLTDCAMFCPNPAGNRNPLCGTWPPPTGINGKFPGTKSSCCEGRLFFNFRFAEGDKTRFLGSVAAISERFSTASGRTSTRWLWKRYERAPCPRRLSFKRRPLWRSSDIKDW